MGACVKIIVLESMHFWQQWRNLYDGMNVGCTNYKYIVFSVINYKDIVVVLT